MLEISKRLIDISEMTRPKEKINKIFKIVLHHAPIKGATAISNRNYINELKKQDDIFCSYHYLIDFDGKIINLVPENEMTIHTGIVDYDMHSISVCLCYDYENKITSQELNSLKDLSKYLINKYSLNPTFDLIRCFDLINKRSPIFFVDNYHNFIDFKLEIASCRLHNIVQFS